MFKLLKMKSIFAVAIETVYKVVKSIPVTKPKAIKARRSLGKRRVYGPKTLVQVISRQTRVPEHQMIKLEYLCQLYLDIIKSSEMAVDPMDDIKLMVQHPIEDDDLYLHILFGESQLIDVQLVNTIIPESPFTTSTNNAVLIKEPAEVILATGTTVIESEWQLSN